MKQTKSILFLARLYHPHIGGVESHVRILSKLLLKKGYSVTVITEKFDKKLQDEETVDGVLIKRIEIGKNTFLKKYLIWKWVLQNTGFLTKHDVIHVHDVFYWLYPAMPFLFTKKVYMTFHGYEGFPIKWTWILQRKIAEKLSKGSICVGDFMKKWYFARPDHVIYGGVRLAIKNVRPNDLTAVFFGRLDDQTGINAYIKAYNILKKKYPKFKLTVIGEGKYRSRIPKEVKVLPFQKDVSGFILKNRFIFVSRYLSFLEALALKREVISVYDNPVKEDYLKMSPFKDYVDIAGSGQEAAMVTENLIKGGKNLRKIEKGYEFSKQQSWENVLKVYLRLWRI